MAQTFSSLKGEYERLLSTMQHTRASESEAAARKVFKNGNRYIEAGKITGVPWPLIGVLDLRESDCNPRAALGQGDPWNEVSTHVPRGKGPFKSWVDAAVYYIGYDHLADVGAWDMPHVCWKGEAWNGWGYRNKGIFTPYLWSGTNHYTRGKYVADGVYSSSERDSQLGIIPVLAKMVEIDPETYIGGAIPVPGTEPSPTVPEPAPYTITGTFWIQSRLNVINAAAVNGEPWLQVDGNYGRRTAAAVRAFQAASGLVVDGQAGDITTAAMDAALKLIK